MPERTLDSKLFVKSVLTSLEQKSSGWHVMARYWIGQRSDCRPNNDMDAAATNVPIETLSGAFAAAPRLNGSLQQA
jgi:hypothetical protein